MSRSSRNKLREELAVLEAALRETQEVLADRAEENGLPRELARWAQEKRTNPSFWSIWHAMVNSASDYELPMLDQMLVNVGLAWICGNDDCRWQNEMEETVCPNCRTPRGESPRRREDED